MSPIMRLQEGFKFALAMTLVYALALVMDWDLAKYAALTVLVISMDTAGASLNKGLARLAGTGVGLLFGWALVGTWSQDPWVLLPLLAAYLTFCGYRMLRSSVPYAWQLAGIVAVLIWSKSYGNVPSAFHFGVFRTLETFSGVIIYMVVFSVFWPRRAGVRLVTEGAEIWSSARRVLARSEQALRGDAAIDEGDDAESTLAGTMASLSATITAASRDTNEVRRRSAAWAGVTEQLRRLANAIEVQRMAADDVRETDGVARAADALPVLVALDERLARMALLWERALDPSNAVGEQREEEPLSVPALVDETVSPEGRMALANLSARLSELDVVSREVASGLAALDASRPPARVPELRETASPLLEPARLALATRPAICVLVGFLIWVFTQPISSPSVVEQSAIWGLVMLGIPDRHYFGVVAIVTFIGLLFLMPIYFFVMPWLGGGPGILVVVFCYSAVFGWVGSKRPILRLGPMLMFAMGTGISNDQSYSLLAFTSLALLLALGFGIVMLVFGLFDPLSAERDMVRSVRAFFAACGRVLDPAEEPAASQLAPKLAAARKAQGFLRPAAAPMNTPERVTRLVTAMQTLALRLGALQLERTRWRAGGRDAGEAVQAPVQRVEEGLRREFDALSRGEAGPPLDEVDEAIAEAERAFAASMRADAEDSTDALRDGYAALGSARYVLAGAKEARAAVADIDWDRWDTPRF